MQRLSRLAPLVALTSLLTVLFAASCVGEAGFMCDDGSSISETSVCDAEPDCTAGEDEAGCVICGDDNCEAPEDEESCSEDCGASDDCGDSACDSGEDASSCPDDCEDASGCGDGTCTGAAGENATSCPEDCVAAPFCGDGNCDATEDNASCAEDCVAAPSCGDGNCDATEDNASCAEDCMAAPSCGDGNCDGTEDNASCPADCPLETSCGDGVCDLVAGEDTFACAGDCPALTCGAKTFGYTGAATAEFYGSSIAVSSWDEPGHSQLSLQLRLNEGAALAPATYTLSGQSWETCAACLTFEFDIFGGTASPPVSFFAERGTVEVTALSSGEVSVTVTGAILHEVVFDESYTTATVVEGGEVFCLEDITLTAPIEMFGCFDEVCTDFFEDEHSCPYDCFDVSTCDHVGFRPYDWEGDTVAETLSWNEGDAIRYYATNSSVPPNDELSLEWYQGFGAAAGPHSFDFTGENYADCHTCGRVFAQCENGSCQKVFLAESGRLEVSSMGGVGDVLAGQLTAARFVEVTIDADTFVSTPVVDGETWCVPEHDFGGLTYSTCGDGVCGYLERVSSCPADCSACDYDAGTGCPTGSCGMAELVGEEVCFDAEPYLELGADCEAAGLSELSFCGGDRVCWNESTGLRCTKTCRVALGETGNSDCGAERCIASGEPWGLCLP